MITFTRVHIFLMKFQTKNIMFNLVQAIQ